jgi:hypothetical protein
LAHPIARVLSRQTYGREAKSKILQHQASAGVKDAKPGSEPEPKKLQQGAKVIADPIFARLPMLPMSLISKPDEIVAKYK